jgi:hypothetical protein
MTPEQTNEYEKWRPLLGFRVALLVDGPRRPHVNGMIVAYQCDPLVITVTDDSGRHWDADPSMVVEASISRGL